METTTLTIRNIDIELLEKLKFELGVNTYSKVVLHCVETYLLTQVALEDHVHTVNELTKELEYKDQVLDQLRGVCTQVLETANQGDLLNA